MEQAMCWLIHHKRQNSNTSGQLYISKYQEAVATLNSGEYTAEPVHAQTSALIAMYGELDRKTSKLHRTD